MRFIIGCYCGDFTENLRNFLLKYTTVNLVNFYTILRVLWSFWQFWPFVHFSHSRPFQPFWIVSVPLFKIGQFSTSPFSAFLPIWSILCVTFHQKRFRWTGPSVSADDKYRKGSTTASLLPSSADKINIKGAIFQPLLSSQFLQAFLHNQLLGQ